MFYGWRNDYNIVWCGFKCLEGKQLREFKMEESKET